MVALEALVQSRFKFAGKERNPGEVISAEDWATATPVAQAALVNQKLVMVRSEGEEVDGLGSSEHLQAQLEALRGEVAKLRDAAEKPSPALIEAIRAAVREEMAGSSEAIEEPPEARKGRGKAKGE